MQSLFGLAAIYSASGPLIIGLILNEMPHKLNSKSYNSVGPTTIKVLCMFGVEIGEKPFCPNVKDKIFNDWHNSIALKEKDNVTVQREMCFVYST